MTGRWIPWWWRHHYPVKCWYIHLYHTIQYHMKTPIFIVTTMRTTSLAQLNILLQSQMVGKSLRIKLTSVYENMWIYYILILVNLLHILVTFCGHIEGGVLMKDTLQCGLQTQHHDSTWMVIETYSTLTLLTQVNLAHIILSVNDVLKISILYLYKGLVVFVIYSL